jgi:hypothetical protein
MSPYVLTPSRIIAALAVTIAGLVNGPALGDRRADYNACKQSGDTTERSCCEYFGGEWHPGLEPHPQHGICLLGPDLADHPRGTIAKPIAPPKVVPSQ